MFEGLSGDVAFEAAHDLCGVLSFVASAGHVGFGALVAGHAGQYDPVQGCVGLAVTATVEPVTTVRLA